MQASIVIGAGESLSLDGGTIWGSIVNNGTFNFNSGSLFTDQIITIGSGGLFGNSLSLTANRRLSAGGIQVTSGSSLAVNSGSHGTLGGITNEGSVVIADGGLLETGLGGSENYSHNDGTTVVNGALSADTLLITGGTVRGTGVIDANSIIVDGGVLTPGNSTGNLHMSGALILTENGTLQFEIGSDPSGGYLWDQLLFADFASALTSDFQGGEIQFSLLDGVTIAVLESSFTIDDFFRVSDPFADPVTNFGLFMALPLTDLANVSFIARDDNFLWLFRKICG